MVNIYHFNPTTRTIFSRRHSTKYKFVMKTKLIFIVLASTLFIIQSCEKRAIDFPEFAIDTNSDTIQFLDVPTFPASVIHVLHREFVISNPDVILTSELLDSNYISHMENRLIQLYPNVAFIGMLNFTDGKLQPIINDLPSYIDTVDVIDMDTIPSLFSEKRELNMDSIESFEWQAFEALAQKYSSSPATLDEILETDSTLFASSGKTNINWCKITYAYYLSAIATPWASFRVWQSGRRAERMEKKPDYYGSYGTDNKSDAFRHITWNVLMRRYVGNTIAYLTAGANEVCGSNKCSSKQMDFHNNYIGRVSKYSLFRDKQNTKRWQWKKWCENVRTFVNDSNNAVYVGDGRWWDNTNKSETKTCKQIRKDRKTISDYKYIYLK